MQISMSQNECEAAFRQWADTLIAYSSRAEKGWVIEGKGVHFWNYGWGVDDGVTDQVALGFDPNTGSSAVKIRCPDASQRDKGRLTVLAIDERGHRHLLRQGYLTANNESELIRDRFAELSKLDEVPLLVDGVRSKKQWFVVADVDAPAAEILASTASFSLACTRARVFSTDPTTDEIISGTEETEDRPTYGQDEKGGVITVAVTGAERQVTALQGYVFEQLKAIVGSDLKKPSRNGYCVDGHVGPSDLLIEIKTSSSAQAIYEAVGQLMLYPALVGVSEAAEKLLLLPNDKPLNRYMASALDGANISVFAYAIERTEDAPKIRFPDTLVQRCKRPPTAEV